MEAYKKVILNYDGSRFGYRTVDESPNYLQNLVVILENRNGLVYDGFVLSVSETSAPESLITPTVQDALHRIHLGDYRKLSEVPEVYLHLFSGIGSGRVHTVYPLSEYLIDEQGGRSVESTTYRILEGDMIGTLKRVNTVASSPAEYLENLKNDEIIDDSVKEDIEYLQSRLTSRVDTSNVAPEKRKHLGYLSNRGDLFLDKELVPNKLDLDDLVYSLDGEFLPYQFTEFGDFVLNPNGRVLVKTLSDKSAIFGDLNPKQSVKKLLAYLWVSLNVYKGKESPVKLRWDDDLLQLLYYSIKLEYVPKVSDRSKDYFLREHLFYPEDIKNIIMGISKAFVTDVITIDNYKSLLLIMHVSRLLNGNMVVDLNGEISRLEFSKCAKFVKDKEN